MVFLHFIYVIVLSFRPVIYILPPTLRNKSSETTSLLLFQVQEQRVKQQSSPTPTRFAKIGRTFNTSVNAAASIPMNVPQNIPNITSQYCDV